MTAPVLRLFKIHGGWWRMEVEIDGVILWNVRLGTRDDKLAQQKLAKYRHTEQSLYANATNRVRA
jgi:hypothetical protein